MAATALVQVKIEPEIKSTAEKVFADYGMNTSTVLRMFLNNVAQTRSLSFQYEPEVEEEECSYEPTPEFAAYLDKEIENIKAGRDLIEFDSMDDAIAYLKKRMKR